jgi:hypothetical protein
LIAITSIGHASIGDDINNICVLLAAAAVPEIVNIKINTNDINKT